MPPSLQHADLRPVWQAVRERLDRYDEQRRGVLRVDGLSEHARLVLESLIGRPVNRQLDLAILEQALITQGIATDLDAALTRLGAEASPQLAARRQTREQRDHTRQAVTEAVADWPEPWAAEWASWLFSSGQFARTTPDQLLCTVQHTRRLLDALASSDSALARTDVAVSLFGSAHALDDGTLLERCARRALWHRLDEPLGYSDGRALWSASSVLTDRVSAQVLGWRLPLRADSALGTLATAATTAGVPIHLSAYALDKHSIQVASTAPVLLVENPRLIESAAERNTPFCVICTHGNPSGAVLRLVDGLLQHGVTVRHHGDFDAAGIAIVKRMYQRGCTPWLMTADDYQSALSLAAEHDIDLPRESGVCGETPWDLALHLRFEEDRLQVHEELLIERVLSGDGWGPACSSDD